ncbi:MAG: hypothetical protein A2493_01400 [Candidatus Magasanikbacteria bacterium RIFOXYC12_FULL_33_11]|uniref:Nudix hydrolase domain-containing protein n=1 Tax=Candidatus Magasanikbacteria bacterium RIFOXYC12_FULL_33_11 TaxID=1798701 RepID=A0A1F6NMJ6_9BACT|nr:MAG: hypothetical protein A2493_01400 [Candidatus Magasanikbacteria bacterium RIFOXYC12_FULL_33_11]
MRVYVVICDAQTSRVALNIKDATLPENLTMYEGMVGLFGGKKEEGETLRMALERELREEIPNFVRQEDLETLQVCLEAEGVVIFSLQTDLSGDRHNRANSRIGQLAATCKEGDGVVCSFDWVAREPTGSFLEPVIHEAIKNAIASREE